MAKKLKLWSGPPLGKYARHYPDKRYDHIYVCAYSQKHALELMETACDTYIGSTHYIRNYMNDAWGTSASEIDPEIGVWISYHNKIEGTVIRRIL